MFFRRKHRTAADAPPALSPKAVQPRRAHAPEPEATSLEGSTPRVEEAVEEARDEAPAAAAIAVLSDDKPAVLVEAGEGGGEVDTADEGAIRLFPGFERDDFEVGYRADGPTLVLRWKDGGDWFDVPSLFNRGILAAMDERESASDLNRLLRNYGYDVDAA